MSVLAEDEMRAQLRRQNIPTHLIERAIRMAKLRGDVAGAQGIETPDEAAMAEQDERLEKAIVAAADKRLRALGFAVWNLSQPRASKIAAGVPDRLYSHPDRRMALFWEAKTAAGKQRPDQRVFQEHMDACGVHYVLGTDTVLYAWLHEHGVRFNQESA